MIGTVSGRLTVVGKSDAGPRLWACRCECGAEKDVRADHLRTGAAKSCGCLVRETTAARNAASATHGRAGRGDRTYASWQAMRTRCLNPKSSQFSDYGGRGITIASRWDDFAAFLADMGERPAGSTLDRWPDNDGDYGPGNCRWATMRQQENNKRCNVLLTHDGRTQTVAEWAREKGMIYQTIRARLRGGWTVADALTLTPAGATLRRCLDGSASSSTGS